ncbi:MAG: septum formation protein Maf [Clostridiales bacterium]|nr:septum formation protein Maf [Clostridiales bacterium]
MQLILASASPRRKEILQKEGYNFQIISSDYDEKSFTSNPIITAKTFAFEKAKDVFNKLEDKNAVVLGADTVVYLKGEILGKPIDRQDAKRILKNLSGNKHKVITGYAIISKDKTIIGYDKSTVIFNKLSDSQIESYLDSNLYIGKAGAYGIQDGEFNFVKKYKGSMNNIIGLPIEKIKKALKKFDK